MSLRKFVIGTLAVVAASLAGLISAAPASAAATDRADRALQRALEKVVDAKGGPPGVIAVVQRGRQRQVLTAGVSKLGSDRPPRASMHMRLASTSKAFSGAIALSLVESGELNLDDTVGEILPSLAPEWSNVTLQQALTHTSGIPSFTTNAEFLDALSANPLVGPPDQASLLSYVTDEPLVFPPDSSYAYSNSDNIVVALMAEEATGLSYRQVLRREVLRPLGMRKTSLPPTAKMPKPFIHGYDTPGAQGDPEDYSEVLDPNWTGASGGLVSTPRDLNVFARGYISGELFGKGVRRQQLDLVKGSSEPPGPGRNRAGAGIFRYRSDCGTVFGHTGNLLGYTQFFGATKNGRRSVTVSATTQLSPDLNEKVFEVLLKADEKAVCAALAR